MRIPTKAAIGGAIILVLAAPVRAQQPAASGTPEKVMQETARILSQAKAKAGVETALRAAEFAAAQGRPDPLVNGAQRKLKGSSGDEERQLIGAVDRKLEPAMSSAAPEGRVLIAQSAKAPATRAPNPAAPGNASGAAGAQGPGKAKPAADQPKDIDIKSEGAVYLDSAQALAIFTDDVVLVHPTFHLTCDKLEAYFVKESGQKGEAKADAGAPPPKGTNPAAPPKAQPSSTAPAAPQSGDAKLKQAFATGKKVVVQKLDENGNPQIGICRHLTYVGESGDVILREMPQVQRGNNVIIARDPSTYMVMKQNGELKVHGPADTKIQSAAEAGKSKPPPANTPPGTPVSTPKPAPKK